MSAFPESQSSLSISSTADFRKSTLPSLMANMRNTQKNITDLEKMIQKELKKRKIQENRDLLTRVSQSR